MDRTYHIQRVSKTAGGKVYQHAYIRQSYREDGKVKKRTLANLSCLDPQIIDALERMLKGEQSPVAVSQPTLELAATLPHGHVEAVLSAIAGLGLDKLIYSRNEPWRKRLVAMIANRLICPGSKSALLRWLPRTSLGEMLGLQEDQPGCERRYYEAMDHLLQSQTRIERQLASRHLSVGQPALYDVSSSYFEGRQCPLAYLGYSRDKKRNKLQITYALMTNAEGCPVAIEVFDGNTHDTATLASAVEKISKRFGIEKAILVGDRGMISEAKLHDIGEANLDWITSLKASQIRSMVQRGLFQPDMFEDKQILEVSDPEYPAERFSVCMNKMVADERSRKREDMLAAAEQRLTQVKERVEKGTLKGKEKIAVAVDRAFGRMRMQKHFLLETASDTSFSFRRNKESIQTEAHTDGIYVIRTSVAKDRLDAAQVVAAYKNLKHVERAFRSIKTTQLHVRPIHHRLEPRVRAHMFVAMLAYYVEWHLRRAWNEHLAKAGENKSTLTDLLAQLALITKAQLKTGENTTILLEGTPTSFQKQLLDLAAQIRPACTTGTVDKA